jgi:hypothetical protein
MPGEDLARGVEIAAVADRDLEPRVLDLRDVDGRVPGREERRGADRGPDLVGQGVHVVAEQRAGVGIGAEIEPARGRAEFRLHRLEQRMPVMDEGIFAGPDALDDLEPRIAAMRLHAEQPAAGPERPGERRDHPARLELQRRTGAIGLRGDDEIVVGARGAASRDHLVEQEAMVGAIENQHDRTFVDRVAALGADMGAPVLGEEALQPGDLVLSQGASA